MSEHADGEAADGAATDGAGSDGSDAGGDADRRREVEVPMAVYKVVTVFSTLFAIVLVVGGMVALDAATARGEALLEEVHLGLATLGVLSIVAGAAVYAFSTRFRAVGMGNPKDADGEHSNDGRRVR